MADPTTHPPTLDVGWVYSGLPVLCPCFPTHLDQQKLMSHKSFGKQLLRMLALFDPVGSVQSQADATQSAFEQWKSSTTAIAQQSETFVNTVKNFLNSTSNTNLPVTLHKLLAFEILHPENNHVYVFECKIDLNKLLEKFQQPTVYKLLQHSYKECTGKVYNQKTGLSGLLYKAVVVWYPKVNIFYIGNVGTSSKKERFDADRKQMHVRNALDAVDEESLRQQLYCHVPLPDQWLDFCASRQQFKATRILLLSSRSWIVSEHTKVTTPRVCTITAFQPHTKDASFPACSVTSTNFSTSTEYQRLLHEQNTCN